MVRATPSGPRTPRSSSHGNWVAAPPAVRLTSPARLGSTDVWVVGSSKATFGPVGVTNTTGVRVVGPTPVGPAAGPCDVRVLSTIVVVPVTGTAPGGGGSV